MEYEIRIPYSTIADLKREAARLLGEDLDGLRRDLDEALDDAATLRESLAEVRRKMTEAQAEVERLRGILPARGPTVTDAVVGALLRAGWDNVARCLAEGRSTLAECVQSMSRCLDRSNPKDAALAVVLEAAVAEAAPAPSTTPPVPGPTALDAVAGMLYRHGWLAAAGLLFEGRIDAADAIARLRSAPVDRQPMAAACIAALEALAAREACPVGHGAGDACAECAPDEQAASAVSVGARERLGRELYQAAVGFVCERYPDLSLSEWESLHECWREPIRRIGEQFFSMGLTAGRAEAKEEREALRKRRDEIQSNLISALQEYSGLVRQMRVLVGFKPGVDIAEAVAAVRKEAREQGAADMRERAAALVCDEGRTGCLRAFPHLAQHVVDVILSLPLDGEKVEERR